MADAKTPDPCKVVTGAVRLSYVNLLAPRAREEGEDPKYSCAILIPKSDTATLSKLKRAQKQAIEVGKTTKWNNTIPKNLKFTLRDGDEEADLDVNPEYAGHYFMNVSSDRKPGLVDKDVQAILDPTEIYSGMWARVSLRAYPFNTKGNKGVTFGLNHVQKVRDDEPFGNVSRAEDDFDAIEDEGDGGLLSESDLI